MPVDDAFTVALLHMDGTHGSTTFTDESGKTWTAAGNAQISTASPKFGTGAYIGDGSGDRLTTPDAADFDFASADFTVECLFRIRAAQSGKVLLTQRNSTGFAPWSLNYEGSGVVQFLSSFTGASWAVVISETAPGIVVDTWYHLAGVRHGNNWRMFFQGTQLGSTVSASGSLMGSSDSVSIGATGDGSGSLDGMIDEVRISKGIARWTSNFTPPTAPYAPPSIDTGNFLAFF
jgi:hypothetical protein